MLSLVIPVYRNEEALSDLLAAVHGLSEQLSGGMEIIFVVDGSPDRCYEILRERLPKCVFRSRLVLLTRNFGSFAAIKIAFDDYKVKKYAMAQLFLKE